MWVNGPVGLGAEHRVLRLGMRSVLVVVPFVVAGTRLMDVLPLLEADHRVMTVFTVAPASNGTICAGAEEFIRAAGGLVIPWHQAVQTEFDVILAASATGVAELHGRPALVSHGAGAVGMRLRSRSAGSDAAGRHPLDRETLTCKGRVLPRLLALAHDSELAVLRESCQEALPAAVVTGDVCYDRLVASLPLRDHYRAAFGLRPGQRLAVVTTTWQPESTLGRHPALLDRLVAELSPDECRVAAIVHPNVWHVHGEFQVRAWFADALRAGLLLLPPEEGWRAALVAADVVVGDYGSVTNYGAAIGAPVLLAGPPARDFVRPGCAADLLCQHAAQLRSDRPLGDQLFPTTGGAWQADIAALLTSRPGQAGQILRTALYRLLDLSEPARAVPVSPVPLPKPITGTRHE
jgi:hypothetical protein